MLWTWRPRYRSSIPGRNKGLFSSSKRASGCGTLTATYLMIIAASYAGGKAAEASLPLVSTLCLTCFHGLAFTFCLCFHFFTNAGFICYCLTRIGWQELCPYTKDVSDLADLPIYELCHTSTDLSDFVQRFLISPFSPAPVALPQLCNVLLVSNIIWHLRKAVAKAHTELPMPVHPSISPHRTAPFPLQGYL
jgi:hypothetical protein